MIPPPQITSCRTALDGRTRSYDLITSNHKGSIVEARFHTVGFENHFLYLVSSHNSLLLAKQDRWPMSGQIWMHNKTLKMTHNTIRLFSLGRLDHLIASFRDNLSHPVENMHWTITFNKLQFLQNFHLSSFLALNSLNCIRSEWRNHWDWNKLMDYKKNWPSHRGHTLQIYGTAKLSIYTHAHTHTQSIEHLEFGEVCCEPLWIHFLL